MNEWLSIIIFIFTIIIITVVLLVSGYPIWHALAFAFLIGILVLLVCFPWNFNDHEFSSSGKPFFNYNAVFWVLLLISIIYLIFYIIFSVYNSKECIVDDKISVTVY